MLEQVKRARETMKLWEAYLIVIRGSGSSSPHGNAD